MAGFTVTLEPFFTADRITVSKLEIWKEVVWSKRGFVIQIKYCYVWPGGFSEDFFLIFSKSEIRIIHGSQLICPNGTN